MVGINNKSNKIKNLLCLWRDSDLFFYNQHKEVLKSGIAFSGRITKDFRISYVVSNNRRLVSPLILSLLREYIFLNKNIFYSAIMFRANCDKVNVFPDDIFDFEIITSSNKISFTGNFVDEVRGHVVDSIQVGQNKEEKIEIRVKLVQEGISRKKYEDESSIKNHELFLVKLNEFTKKEFYYWNLRMSPALTERRLSSLNSPTIEFIDLKKSKIFPKDIVYAVFFIINLTRIHNWAKTNSDCKKEATALFYRYISSCSRLIKKINNKKINLGIITSV